MAINSVDRGTQPLSAYLLKLLTILVSRSPNREIRIPATEMIDDISGHGLMRYYDRDTHELVLSYAPVGAEVYFTKSEEAACPPAANSRPVRPISSSTTSRAYPDALSQPPPQPQSMSSLLSDEQLADREDQLLRERAARLVAEFPQPVSSPARQPREPSPQPSPQPLEQFFRT